MWRGSPTQQPSADEIISTQMSLYDCLKPGDDVCYLNPSIERPFYGRIANRDDTRLILYKYNKVILNRAGLYAIFYQISELVLTEQQEVIDVNQIIDIIYVLTEKIISSFPFTVEGVSSCFFIRYKRVLD